MGGLGGFLTCLGHFLIRPCRPRADREVWAGLPIQPSLVPAAFEATRVSEEVEPKPEAWAPAKERQVRPQRGPEASTRLREPGSGARRACPSRVPSERGAGRPGFPVGMASSSPEAPYSPGPWGLSCAPPAPGPAPPSLWRADAELFITSRGPGAPAPREGPFSAPPWGASCCHLTLWCHSCC